MTERGCRDLLIEGAKELGLSVSDEQADAMFLYLAELRKWNRKINLTAITGDREMVIKHLLDSLSFLCGFAYRPGLRLLDMGSGAGLPAIPIKIARADISIALVESVKKKAAFLRHIVRTLRLGQTEVSDIRTEELPESYNVSYDVVTARAFAGMESALASGGRFLKTGGLMVLSRGPKEIAGDQVKNGFTLEKKIELTLPYSDYKRALWIFKKAG